MNLHLGRELSQSRDTNRFTHYFRGYGSYVFGTDAALLPYAQALVELNAARDVLPDRPEATYYLRQLLDCLGRRNEALVKLEPLAARFPMAEALRRTLRQRRTSTRIADRILGDSEAVPPVVSHDQPEIKHPLNVKPFGTGWVLDLSIAEIATCDGRWQEAVDAYGRVLELTQEPFIGCFLDCSLKRSLACIAAGRYAEAIEDLGVVRSRCKDQLLPGLHMGQAYLLNGDLGQAEQVFLQAHSSTAYPDAAALFFTDIYQSLRHMEMGAAWTDKIQDAFLREFVRATVLFRNKREYAAEEIIRKLLHKYPDNSPLFCLLSGVLRGQRDFVEAEKASKKAIGLDPSNAAAHLDSGLNLEGLGKFKLAKRCFREAIRLAPNDATNYLYIGQAVRRAGDMEGALAIFSESIRQNPGYAHVYYDLGNVHRKMGRTREAIHYFEKAARLLPIPYHGDLADAHGGFGEWCDCFNVQLNGVTALSAGPRGEKFANEFLVYLLKRRGKQRHECTLGGFHVACGGGERLIDTLETVCQSRSDSRILSCLALAYCHVPTRTDHAKAIRTAFDAAQAPGSECPWVRAAVAEVIGHFVKSPLRHKKVLLLEHFEKLPPYFAMDELLALDEDHSPDKWHALVARFRLTSRHEIASRRLAYLTARIDQRAGRYEQAMERLAKLYIDDPQPEIVRHYAECLRRCGRHDRVTAVCQQLEPSASKPTREVMKIAQWDFDGDLEPTIGQHPLLPGAASPAAAPQFSFTRQEIGGGNATVAKFSRGTFFQFWHGFGSEESDPLGQYTLIMDVSLSLGWFRSSALLQPGSTMTEMQRGGSIDKKGSACMITEEWLSQMFGIAWRWSSIWILAKCVATSMGDESSGCMTTTV